MVSDVNINTALQGQANTAASSTGLAEDFSQFLELLTIQLQNQDPLSPMETTEFTNQLVAFTGVEQQINTNQKLDDLVALNLGNATGQALGYVGKNISYVSSEFSFDGQSPTTIKYSLNDTAVDSTLRVLDENGSVVFETAAATAVGQNEFVWDGTLSGGGKAEAGTYAIAIDALDANDEGVGSTVVVEGRVSGIESQGGQVFAIVGDRAVSLGNILSISESGGVSGIGNDITSALSYIGSNVSYRSNSIALDDDDNYRTLGYSLEEEADDAFISILDENGNRVLRERVGTNDGDNVFIWDGTDGAGNRVAEGDYTYTIDARDEDSNSIDYEASNTSVVAGVENVSGNINLTLQNGTTIALSEILSIQPPVVGS